MKIELYVKNRDLSKVNEYLTGFKTSLKKPSKYDIFNHSLTNLDYIQILKIYISDTLIIEFLEKILGLFEIGVNIRISFKYSFYGNTILTNQDEINCFILTEELSSITAVNSLYQVGRKTT